MHCNLSITDFSSIFELFSTYYLFLSISDKFNDYFGISHLFEGWHEKIDLQKLEKIPASLFELKKIQEKNTMLKIKQQSNTDGVKEIINTNDKASKQLDKIISKFPSIKKKCKNIQDEIKRHFWGTKLLKENQNNGVTPFFNSIRPLYINAGISSLTLLVLGGLDNGGFNKTSNIELSNLISIVMIIFSVLFLFSKKATFAYKFKSHSYFILSLIINVCLIICPSILFETLLIFEWHFSSIICLQDLNIAFAIVLAFIPIIIHILLLSNLMRRYNNMCKLIQVISNTLTPPVSPEIGNINEIPELENTFKTN